ncbi:hypothetical protein LSCM1_03054 [Leishmania martiniquensis]|uniref:Uncharacterized protein n=1 Tax=Leishmania martiniquensis TaxID=1580590 RepID=A0A836KFG6_9TRYP|nr:hypothetical protein LSCM1_03054 [Leishmania martiniquensis]
MLERTDISGAKNLQMRVAQSVLFLYCDLSKDCGESSSGKSVLISSTSGNKPLGKSGAWLGLNIFVKSLEKRDLSAGATEALRSASFTDVGEGCQWRVEEDSVTLCIRIDFATVKERLGASGKSMLLASTGGNKPVGGTGLICGLNCYYSVGKAFDASKLAVSCTAEDALRVGQTHSMEGGFLVSYTAPSEMHLTYTYCAEKMVDGHTASLPAFCVGDLKVTLFVSAPKAARARSEKTSREGQLPTASSSLAPSSRVSSHANAGGGWLLEKGMDKRVRNVAVTCTPVSEESAQKATSSESHYRAYRIDLCFDPTRSCGRSSSGKCLMVATTRGFQRVVDSEDHIVCRLSLNAYRPAPPLSEVEITTAVQAVLASKPKAQLPSLSFKEVLAEVVSVLGLSEPMKEAIKPKIKEAAVAFLEEAAV